MKTSISQNTKSLYVSHGVTPNWRIKISASCPERFDTFRDISKYLCIARFLTEPLRCSAEPWWGITCLSGDFSELSGTRGDIIAVHELLRTALWHSFLSLVHVTYKYQYFKYENCVYVEQLVIQKWDSLVSFGYRLC